MISAIALVAALAGSPPTSIATEGMAVMVDGTVLPLSSAADLEKAEFKETESPISHVWLWAPGVPPLKLEAPTASSFSNARLDQGVEWRTLEVLDDRPRSHVGRLISAPAAMWEEVPEPLLPSHPMTAGEELRIRIRDGEPWRVRYLAAGRASRWIDLPAQGEPAVLVSEPAHDWHPRVVGTDGNPVPEVRLSLLDGDDRGVSLRKLADFRGEESGRLEVSAIPTESELIALISAPGIVPRLLRGRVGDLGEELVLDRGSTVTGSVQTADHLPLSGARVEARTWLEGSPIPLHRIALSDETGHWLLENLPRGRLTLVFTAEGLAPLSFPVEVGAERLQVPPVVLSSAHLLQLQVTDLAGLPLPGAEVHVKGRPNLVADSEGELVIDLAPGELFEARVIAAGHTPRPVRRVPPLPRRLIVRLEPAVVVSGRLLDPEGVPVAAGRIEVNTRAALATHEVAEDGRFEVELPAGQEATLRFTSPTTTAFDHVIPPAAAGQQVDLGDLIAPSGVTVTGFLRHGATGEPVVGARIWTPRPRPQGLRMAWVLEDLVVGISDPSGYFKVRGLPQQPVTLRVDAHGLAPVRIPLNLGGDETSIDVGEVMLMPGVDLVVRQGDPGSAANLAAIDLGGIGLELDRITAPFREGEAVLRHVPPGAYDLEVSSAGRVVCTTTVEIEELSGRDEIVCEQETFLVQGIVEVGGRPAGSGRLQWLETLEGAVQPDVILNSGSDFLTRQRVFSSSRDAVEVEVDERGEFEVRLLHAGNWLVLWQPEGGARVGPERLSLAPVSTQAVVLRYPGSELVGSVVDGDGRPVGGAQVRALDGSAFARTEPDGSFSLGALSAGTHRIRARDANRRSPVEAVLVQEDRPPEPVVLVLEAREDAIVAEIVDSDERPAASATVFFDFGAAGLRLASSDSRGRARAEIPDSFAGSLRIAVFHQGSWALGPPLLWQVDRDEPVPVVIGETGSLVLSGDLESPLTPRITSSGGWDLTLLSSWLGRWLRLGPGAVVTLDGLPSGSYTVEVGARRFPTSVTPGETTELEIEADGPLGD